MWFRVWLRVAAMAGIIALLLLGILLAATALAPLPVSNRPQAARFLDASEREFARRYTENRIEVPVTDMSEYLLDAIVAIEDSRFYGHKGIDLLGVGRALLRNLLARKITEGGSTLTQQLARNLYLTQERTVARKLREVLLALKLEASYSKTEILGMYWNTIYLGRGAYGVEVASQTLFGKSAKELSLAEAAFLAGLPRHPEYYATHPDAANRRRDLVLDKMAEQNFISPDDAARAKSAPTRVLPSGQAYAPEEGAAAAPYFLDYVLRELQLRYPQVAADLDQGGYSIHTTLDSNLQRLAEETVAWAALPSTAHADSEVQPQVALVAIEPDSGQIRALIGGRESHVRRNRALEPQQPGSAFKPFVYAAALTSRRYTVVDTQMDAPVVFPSVATQATYRPHNYGDRYSYRPMDMRQALRESVNVVAVQWLYTIQSPPVISLAKAMGIQSRIPDQDLSVALGSAEVSPLEITAAYAPFANGGYAIHPFAIRKVVDRHGVVVHENRPRRTRVLDPGVAFIMTDLLKDVTRPGGTAGKVAGYMSGRPVAGKTGTTDDSRDAWFVGFTPDLVAGVWVGRDDNGPGTGTGGTLAAPLWSHFMSRALHGKPHRDWTPPQNVVRAEVCRQTKLLANPSCPVQREWFLIETAPTEVDPTIHWEEILPGLPQIPWLR